jgi:uncharacterized membrane protein
VFSPTDVEDARTLLSTMAAALLTFTGVVFSLTLVALQMASTQYSPRVLRSFVRKPAVKAALAVFLATFIYSVTLLSHLGSVTQAHTVPRGAVALAFLLVLASVLVFLGYAHTAVRSLRVSYLLQDIADETVNPLTSLFADGAAYVKTAPPDFSGRPWTISALEPERVLMHIDLHALVAATKADESCLRLRVPVGAYVLVGEPLLDVYGPRKPNEAALRKAFSWSPARTLRLDPLYGVRQLVDIACRALSPAVNDPTTAVQALDRLEGLVARVSEAPDPTGLFCDSDRTVRVLRIEPTWDRLFALAFTEVAQFGIDQPQISRRLRSVCEDLEQRVGEARKSVVIDFVARWFVAIESDDQGLRGDRLGLG